MVRRRNGDDEVPGALYVCVAVIGVVWLVALPVVAAELSPQAIEYAHGASFTPGSVKEMLRERGAPAVAVWLLPAFTVGAALAMVAVVVTAALAAPRASVTVSVTV